METLDIIRYLLIGGAFITLLIYAGRAIWSIYKIRTASKMKITRKDNGQSFVLDQKHRKADDLERLIEFMK